MSRPRHELPFAMDTPLRCYHYSAFPSGIAMARGGMHGTVLNHHVQLYFPSEKLTLAGRKAHVRMLPGIGIPQFAAMGYISMACRQRPWLEKLGQSSFCGYVVDAIRQGLYLHTYTDEYYVPGTASYRSRHLRHSLLVLGAADDGSDFTAVFYRRDGTFGASRIAAADLWGAINLHVHGIDKPDDSTVLEELGWTGSASDHVDGALIVAQLEDYYRGRCNLNLYATTGSFGFKKGSAMELPAGPGYCGMSIYEAFRQYFRLPPKALDARATRLLMEHKDMIARALGTIGNQFAASGNLPATYERQILPLCWKLHLVMVQSIQRRSTQPDPRATELLDQIETIEGEALGRVFTAA